MKILFVCSGNHGISYIVSAQAQSLTNTGIQVEIFQIVGRGVLGYLSSLPKLHKQCRKFNPDIIHAHYSLCGIVARLASRKPVVTSLMGSDVWHSGLMRSVIKIFINHLWSRTIVKSDEMKASLNHARLCVLPNGVDLDLFKPMNKQQCQIQLGWDIDKKHALFVSASDSARSEKNLQLAKDALSKCSLSDLRLQVVSKALHSEMPVYFNASDFLLLTSKWEGSPNAVKEAMACNIPVVSTEVGDVRWLFGDEEGFWITNQSASDIAEKIKACVLYIARNRGRDRIISLGLSAVDIAKKLTDIYIDATTNNHNYTVYGTPS